MTCSQCATERQTGNRLPRGWKRSSEKVYCGDCWRKRAILRAVTMPVVEPLSGSWKELRDALAEAWKQTTAASNFILTECYARDVRRQPGEEKMPPMPRVYLYPEIRAKWPELTPQSVASLEQAMQGKYRAKRYEVIWTCASTLPTMRYPQPFPVHNQSWSVYFDDGNRPVISIRIGESRWELRLKGGARYRRQLASVRQMVSGDATRGEAALYKQGDDIMVKMVAWLPRPTTPKGLDGVLRVRTAENSLLVALDDKGERIWTVNADHIPRWIAEYGRTLQRLREDRKAEQRPVPSFERHQDSLVAKQRNRMKSAVQMMAAQLANFARRRRYASVRYDDSAVGYVLSFPYFLLRDRIKTVLDEYGIAFEHASAGEITETGEPLAGE